MGNLPFRRQEIKGLGTRILHIGTRRVKKGVAHETLAFSAQDREKDLLGSPPLMRGNNMLISDNPFGDFLKPVKTPGTRVRLIAIHDPRPLPGTHGRRPAVGQQVDQYLFGIDQKEIVPGFPEYLRTF